MAKAKKGLTVGEDGICRCWWAGPDLDYLRYHDDEWGMPTVDDRTLFEKMCLEGFQSGLSWLTILKKRENFRRAFRNFEIDSVARFDQRSVTRLLSDASIVRHRGKIESTINNARRARELSDEFGTLSSYFRGFEPAPAQRPRRLDHAALMKLTKTPESSALSGDLKRRGWSFVGPTTCYAFMQAMGLVNDHLEGCEWRAPAERERRRRRA
jgi:DNA-3-methyladenine glycosylase I